MICANSHLTKEKNRVGRPRTVSFEPDEMIKLGEGMVKWCSENKPLHLSQFWSVYKDISDDDWETLKKRPEFVRYYAKAMRIIGYSYLDKDSKVDCRVKDRWLRVYFKDLKNQEDEDAKFKAQLSSQDNNLISPKALENSLKHELMIVKAELAGYKEANGINRS